MAMQDSSGDYRDHGTTMCFNGKCRFTTDASGPLFNPTFWGDPKGKLVSGQSWRVELKQPWEFGPPGLQTVTVVSVDKQSGIVILKREGEGIGPYEGGKDSLVIKKDGKQYKVAARYGRAHWVGQAVFQHGIVVSDELLCITPLELFVAGDRNHPGAGTTVHVFATAPCSHRWLSPFGQSGDPSRFKRTVEGHGLKGAVIGGYLPSCGDDWLVFSMSANWPSYSLSPIRNDMSA